MTRKPQPLPHVTLASAGKWIQEFSWMRKSEKNHIRVIHKVAALVYDENVRLSLKVDELEGKEQKGKWQAEMERRKK